jgi:hypothetical protein
MGAPFMKRILILFLAFAGAGTTLVAESPQQAFVKAWTGQSVVVKSTLYSLIYNERGKLGKTRSGLREGLLVATPSQGAYLQFDGRQGRETVVENDPDRLVSAVDAAYVPDALDIRPYRKLEPLAINRFDPGVELVVSGVHIDRDEVKLKFVQPGGGKDAITSIRARWSLPLSSAFAEGALLEDLLRRFIEIKQP